jgi:hypothetical protein
MHRPHTESACRLTAPIRPMSLAIAFVLWFVLAGCLEVKAAGPGRHAPFSYGLLALPGQLEAAQNEAEEFEERRLAADERSDIQWLRSILQNPANEPHTRVGAAVRLMGIDHPEAVQPLAEALLGDDDGMKSAVAAAISEVGTPPRALLDPAVAGLRTARGMTLDQLSLALTRFGAPAHARLLTIATDADREPGDRLGALAALGTFRTHEATDALVSLLDPKRGEPEVIIVAASDALQRATGLPYGNDAAQWRAWWAEAGDLPPEQWLSNLVQRMSEQLATAEQKMERERDATMRVQQRLGQAYRDLFPRLDLEEQLRALPALLDDPLPNLREFAVDRIARLLRDSVRIPEEVQDKLADRINDEVPALRLQAARLLEQMNYDRLALRLSERLIEEKNDDLIEGFLDIISKRPSAVALPSVVPLLESERHGERAAIALWEIVNTDAVDEDRLAWAYEIARNMDEARQSSAHIRLLARIAPEEDLPDLVTLMDGEDISLKFAVAEALMRRGAVEPLLDRVSDESIYPYVVRAVARPSEPWAAFRQLMVLPPPALHESVWREQVLQVAGRLPADRIVEGDDLLAGMSEASIDLRVRVLQRRLAPNENGNGLSPEARAPLTLRLAELLLLSDQPELALERLEASVDAMALPDAMPLRFRAMLRIGQYDRAQQLVPEPEPWIAQLERWASDRPQQAVALREEIERRFNGRLNDALQGQLEAVSERLPAASQEVPSSASEPDGVG